MARIAFLRGYINKLIRRYKGGPLVLGGVVALVILLLLFQSVLARQEDFPISEARLLSAKRFLRAGLPVQFADLALVPRSRFTGELPPGVLTDQDLHWLEGAKMLRETSAGELLTLDRVALANGQVPEGQRGYLIEVSAGLFVRRGDRIDVLAPKSDDGASTILLEGAEVLSVPKRGALMISAAPEEIELLEKGRRQGKLSITLRNPLDTSRTPRRTRKPRVWSKAVPVISEGE